MANGYDLAAPRLGSGGRFRKLSATLAARGASNPDALAAWIGRRKYGATKMARLSHHSHATPASPLAILLASGEQMKCPSCGYQADSAEFSQGADSASDVSGLQKQPGELRTPARGTASTSAGFSPESAGINVRSGPGGAGLSTAMDFTAGNGIRRLPVTRADDIVVGRNAEGRAVVRHRHGGATIGTLRQEGTSWIAALDGAGDLQPHTQQRAALMEMLGTWNRSTVTPARPAMPLQQPPAQTPLMAKYGVENIRAFATPATSAGAGPRVTLANGDGPDAGDGDGDGDLAGLNPKGRGIYAKLRKKGMPAQRALMFAKRAQNFGSSGGGSD